MLLNYVLNQGYRETMLNALRIVWYLSATENIRGLIKQHDIFSTLMQIILVDFSKNSFDQDFREVCIATLSNFSSQENVRLLVYNSMKQHGFYRELVAIFG